MHRPSASRARGPWWSLALSSLLFLLLLNAVDSLHEVAGGVLSMRRLVVEKIPGLPERERERDGEKVCVGTTRPRVLAVLLPEGPTAAT